MMAFYGATDNDVMWIMKWCHLRRKILSSEISSECFFWGKVQYLWMSIKVDEPSSDSR